MRSTHVPVAANSRACASKCSSLSAVTNPSNAATRVGLHFLEASDGGATRLASMHAASRLEPALSRTNAMYGNVEFRSVPLSCAPNKALASEAGRGSAQRRTQLAWNASRWRTSPPQHSTLASMNSTMGAEHSVCEQNAGVR